MIADEVGALLMATSSTYLDSPLLSNIRSHSKCDTDYAQILAGAAGRYIVFRYSDADPRIRRRLRRYDQFSKSSKMDKAREYIGLERKTAKKPDGSQASTSLTGGILEDLCDLGLLRAVVVPGAPRDGSHRFR